METPKKKAETPQLNRVFKNTETPQIVCGNTSTKQSSQKLKNYEFSQKTETA